MLAAWDRQLKALAADVDLLLDYHSRMQIRADRAFRLRAVDLLKTQAQLDKRLEQVRQLSERDIYLMPREKALLHGARTLLARLDEYARLRGELLAQGLWHNLLKTRICGPQAPAVGGDDNFGGDDLLALSVRRGGLAQTEIYLKDRLKQLDKERDKLEQAYACLDLVEANRVASLSLAIRLGATPEAAMRSPLLGGLKLLLKTATARTLRPAAAQKLAHGQDRLAKKTDSLISLCRNLIVAGLERTSDLDPANGLNRPGNEDEERIAVMINHKLTDVDELTNAVQGAFATAIHGPIAPWKTPILVQKRSKKAKTGALGM